MSKKSELQAVVEDLERQITTLEAARDLILAARHTTTARSMGSVKKAARQAVARRKTTRPVPVPDTGTTFTA